MPKRPIYFREPDNELLTRGGTLSECAPLTLEEVNEGKVGGGHGFEVLVFLFECLQVFDCLESISGVC